jgi:SAM-dependent methyltransferase
MLGEITALPFPDCSFDLVCAFDIVEHIENDRQSFRELGRVAKDDATVIFSVPLHPARWSAFDALVGHVRRYDPKDLLAILGEHFFVLEERELACSEAAGSSTSPCVGRLTSGSDALVQQVFLPLAILQPPTWGLA